VHIGASHGASPIAYLTGLPPLPSQRQPSREIPCSILVDYRTMLCVILGAGFSCLGGVPLALQLFDERPEVDRVSRERLVESVVGRWEKWRLRNGGSPEEYLSELEQDSPHGYQEAVRFVALRIALPMGKIEYVGGRGPTLTRHNVNRTTGIPSHEHFWTSIFSRTTDVAVLTTNYDILPERGIRHVPRLRVHRPGFHYGAGPERLAGGGYLSYAHIQEIAVSGRVPLYKLHGSISWSVRDGLLVKYHDCRPAVRGDAAIVAPITEKRLPQFLDPIWRGAASCLAASRLWIVAGYSLPSYDLAVRRLLRDNAVHNPHIHVFDPRPEVAAAFSDLLPGSPVRPHGGVPSGLQELEMVVASA